MFQIEYLNRLRAAEIAKVAAHIPARARVLEIGAGTGQQALELKRLGFDVAAIELKESAYSGARVFPITDYDGAHIPFPDASFDVVFSSNALEHVRDLAGMHAEIKRVLKPDGLCVHVLPTHAWRFWSSLTAYPNALRHLGRAIKGGGRREWGVALRWLGSAALQPRHGERGHAADRAVDFPSALVAAEFPRERLHAAARRADGAVLHRQHVGRPAPGFRPAGLAGAPSRQRLPSLRPQTQPAGPLTASGRGYTVVQNSVKRKEVRGDL